MRILTSILCVALCGPAAAAETYRWVDKNGTVHYSDQPSPGAERIPLNSAPLPGSVAPQRPTSSPAPAAKPFAYTGCEFISPNAEQVFFSVNSVNASLRVTPSLQSGHRITVQMNGRFLADWPSGSTDFLLQNLFRGSYSLLAVIVDGEGKPQCTSSALSFHIRQPSMLTPGAQAAPRS